MNTPNSIQTKTSIAMLVAEMLGWIQGRIRGTHPSPVSISVAGQLTFPHILIIHQTQRWKNKKEKTKIQVTETAAVVHLFQQANKTCNNNIISFTKLGS